MLIFFALGCNENKISDTSTTFVSEPANTVETGLVEDTGNTDDTSEDSSNIELGCDGIEGSEKEYNDCAVCGGELVESCHIPKVVGYISPADYDSTTEMYECKYQSEISSNVWFPCNRDPYNQHCPIPGTELNWGSADWNEYFVEDEEENIDADRACQDIFGSLKTKEEVERL